MLLEIVVFVLVWVWYEEVCWLFVFVNEFAGLMMFGWYLVSLICLIDVGLSVCMCVLFLFS